MMPSKLDAAAALESMDSMDALQSKPLTMIPDEMRPAFDYSGLDEQTVDDLHFAEKEYQHGKKLAERGLVHMGNAIAAAHDALCGVVQQLDNSKHGNRGDDSFRAWCCSIGITKSTAYNLLQVSALMDGSSPRQRAILEALPPTLLYAVAKPSAPAELVEKVKNGEVSTNKEYQDLLAQIKAEKERADAAEKSAQNARKENAYFKELVKSAEAQTHKDAEKREEAESRYESALADISGLKEQNAQLKERADSAEAREEEAWKMQSKAEARAHDALCGVVQQLDNSKHGNRGDDSFRAWCCSIGITKSTAYNLLQVSALMDGSSPRQRAILEALPPTLLYAVAKPSAPAELVEKVKNGEVSTNKEYQDLLAQIKAEKERADAAEKSAQNARKENAYFKELVKSAEAQTHKDAEKREEAESRYESALADISGLKEQNAQLKERADSAEAREEEAWKMQSKAEARAHKAEDALKHQPITGVVDKDEVKRQAEALSRNAVQEARQQAAEAQARLRQYQEDAEGLLAPAQACAQQAQFIADSVRAMYLKWFGNAVAADASLAQMGTPLYAVCGEIMSSLEEENTINPTAAGSEEDAEREALFE